MCITLLLANISVASQLEALAVKANKGDADAQFHLGLMYGNGEGTPQDYKQAVKWYTKAANKGDADA